MPALASSFLLLQDEMPTGIIGAFLGAYLLFILVLYLFTGYCLMLIANKTNTPNGWWGFVPILNLILMVQVAQKPLWWILLMFIPLVNIIIAVIIFMAIAERRGKPAWWGILMLVPLANLVILAALAFTD